MGSARHGGGEMWLVVTDVREMGEVMRLGLVISFACLFSPPCGLCYDDSILSFFCVTTLYKSLPSVHDSVHDCAVPLCTSTSCYLFLSAFIVFMSLVGLVTAFLVGFG